MIGRLGIAATSRLFGAANANLSPELAQHTEVAFAPTGYVRTPRHGRLGAYRLPSTVRRGVVGVLQRRFVDDYYDRIHIIPSTLVLGNVVSQQVRTLAVWNAWRDRAQTVTASALTVEAGIDVASPGAVPIAFAPLQERAWTLTVRANGPPTIDTALRLMFTQGATWSVPITGLRLAAWTLPPDWSEDVTETLAWLTDVQETFAGETTRTPLRAAPRRSWEFSVLADARERRIIEHALFDASGRAWALPVFVETVWLSAPVPLGATTVAFDTAGLDLAVGRLAMLWRDVVMYELVEITAITATRVALRAPTLAAWPRGTRLIPCRTARLTDAPTLRRHSDRLMATRLRFEATEPCDWPALAPPARYRGWPVLEDRLEWSEAPTASFVRRLTVLDNETGLVVLDDASGLTWSTQSHAWRLVGRAARARHRSLLYWLQGRAEALWWPTWTDDLAIVAPVGETSPTLTVAWAGVTRSLRQQAGRDHLRIELHDSTVFYRAVEASSDIALPNSDPGERLRLDAALGRLVTPEQVRLVSWMALVTLASDTVELRHINSVEGLLDCAVNVVGVPGEGA